jgi:dipeptidyl aminopeptidase/acylaminoacyl peptidase
MRIYSAIVVLLATPLAAQQQRQLTVDDYARAEKFLSATAARLVPGIAGKATWLSDNRFWYLTTVPNGSQFYIVDPARKSREPAFNQSRLAAALAAVSRGTVRGDSLPFQTFEYSTANRSITVTLQTRRWTCDLQTYACSPQDTLPTSRNTDSSSISPDGKTAVYIKQFNLWVRDLKNGAERQLTSDGIEDFGYATDNAGWVHSARPIVTWSGDSKRIATFQHDGRGVHEFVLSSTNVGAPKIERWRYPFPGDSVIFRISRVIIDVPSGKVTRLKMPPDAHRSTVNDDVNCGGSVCDAQWYSDGSKLAFISSSRDHKHGWMRIADAVTGDVRTLFEETSTTQIGNASLDENLWRALPKSNELIWWSQRDNWLQLYLYDLTTGKLKNKITTDTGNVDEIIRVDEKTRTIYYLGSGKETGRDPYFQHLYRVGFDGRGEKLLTPEDANHVISMSLDGKFIFDSYSTPSVPPVTVVRDADGRVVQVVEKADVSRLVAIGWHPPTEFKVKGRDGRTDIYGLMYTPSNLDSTKKYPIINYIYPGPQSGSVGSRNFSPARRDNQALAELGFIVVAIDGMGTPQRSKSFMDTYYGRMGDNTLPDQVAGMKELAKRYSFIDIDKVGIWGHSGGGFATAAAMFKFGDFFDVGIAESGNHDNRNYEDDWGERYQGLVVTQGATDNYAAEANQTYAKNLKGKLLLVHGGMDPNVPPSNTMLVADALIKANKDFDLLILPNARHEYRGADDNYSMRRRWDYFVKNLLGAEPPKEYQIGRQRAVR